MRVSIETRNRGADSGEFPGSGQFVRVDVQDKGAGISCENLARLFKDIVQFNPASLQVLLSCLFCRLVVLLSNCRAENTSEFTILFAPLCGSEWRGLRNRPLHFQKTYGTAW